MLRKRGTAFSANSQPLLSAFLEHSQREALDLRPCGMTKGTSVAATKWIPLSDTIPATGVAHIASAAEQVCILLFYNLGDGAQLRPPVSSLGFRGPSVAGRMRLQ